MAASGIGQLLEEGISAIKAGDRVRARELLMRVVEADERNKRAWLWLSLAVDDPADKLVALENVATIEALEAQAAAVSRDPVELRRHLPPADLHPEPVQVPPAPSIPYDSPPLPASARVDYAPASRQEEDDGIDDPHQCVFCGFPAAREDSRCPRCGRELVIHKRKLSRSMSRLRFATTLLSLNGVLGLVEVFGPAFAFSGYGGAFDTVVEWAGAQRYFNAVEALLGNFTSMAAGVALALLMVGVVRCVALFVSALGFQLQVAWLYYFTIGFLLLDLVWSAFLFSSGHGGWLAILANAGLALGILSLAFGAERDFRVDQERLLAIPDGDAHGALDFFRRGRDYRRRGMWALAVAQWRRAVALIPAETQFYKDLGIAYAQIGRFERSLRVLQAAAGQSPNDLEIPELIALVKAQKANLARGHGATG